MDALIQLTEVGKTIPHSSAKALKNATCTIYRGEFVSIIGTSGSGKTTLLSILGLLDHPSSGTYLFDGVDVDSLDEKAQNAFRGHRIGFVFQNSYLVAEESTARNVGLGLRVRGVAPSRQGPIIDTRLRQVGLIESSEKTAGDLSGGEKQRAAVARALATSPEVILADEPTGALDADSTIKLIDLLRDINAIGTTVVVVTHDPLVAQAADRIIQIEDGVVTDPGLSAKSSANSRMRELTQSERRTQNLTAMESFTDKLTSSRSSATVQRVGDALTAPLDRMARSVLVVIAYILGVAALVGALGVMNGTTGQIVKRLTEAGSNQITVIDTSPIDGSWTVLDSQARTLAPIEGVHDSIPIQTFTVVANTVTRLRGTGEKFTGRILMTDERFMAAYQMIPQVGQVDLLSNRWNGVVVVLGAVAAQTLGVASIEPGVSIWVNDRPADVVAILRPTGDILLDDALYFSPGSGPVLLDSLNRMVEVHTQPGYAEPLAVAIPIALSPGNPGQIQTSTVAQLVQLQQGINTDLGALLSVIGSVVLVLSALTAGTTMFLSVQHRGAEIALRRAMGASRWSIFSLFTIEGVAIGTTGGIFGTGLGIALTMVITHVNNWPLALGVGIVAQGVAVGFTAGAVASIIPAIYASRRDPAQILRTV